MVRFKTRWLLLAIDDKPLATASPFPLATDDASVHVSTSATTLSAAQKSSPTSNGAASTLTPQLITRLLRASLVYNFGDVASGAFGGVLTCKYYSTHTGTAIVRCSRDAARLVWASATMISSPVEMSSDDSGSGSSAKVPSLRIRVVHCGGTIKKVQNKAIELDRRLIMRLRAKQHRRATALTSAESVVSTKQAPQEKPPLAVQIAPADDDDDEDLGEALQPAVPNTQATEASITTTPQVGPQSQSQSNSKAATLDPETQALLHQSRKQISSISH
ncbi:potential RNAseP/MRP complex component [Pseudozyma hubeiensis SY62]|uniref:Potential RNAseP/MRP complex component n=1 Tax=Pseudozyma hubeiensis (strain SY62) TaxID=1305764 RepID=R9P7G5_PSEHS|nr:potential RNAseP/MRP complex component [Pseudozyma hubeiensis SY62]GAC94050.1 potential RNAseP/MRP complex component [Pseudozyma hubeiensis SY62]